MINLFDAHCHPDDTAFDEDREVLLDSLPQNGIKHIVWAGTNQKTNRAALQGAQKYPYIYCACGYYPHETHALDNAALDELAALLQTPKCVALGEIGLDYHYDDVDRATQIKAFNTQLDLAAQYKKPVVIHERDACADVLAALKAHPDVTGMLHCYSGSAETAKQLIAMGYYISFSGLLTFKNARQAPDCAKALPHDRILIETDSPYMTPEPYRGRRNNPALVALVAQRLSTYWDITPQEVADITCKNACTLFGIKA